MAWKMAAMSMSMRLPQTRRFTEIDFLMIAIWASFLLVFVNRKPFGFMAWAIAGGGLMIVQHLYNVCYKGQKSEGNLVIAALTLIFQSLSGAVLGLINAWTPVTYDAQLAKLDMGIAPAVRAWTEAHVTVNLLLNTVYSALPFMLLLCAMSLSGRNRVRLVYSIVVAGILVVPCYLIFPAVGPIHAGDPNADRNCMPSMHLTWALLMFINSKGVMKYITGVFAILTAAATLSMGEHYVLDLIAALPWTGLITVVSRKLAK